MARIDIYRILLIRTGATDWDERDHLPGLADLPLCTSGRKRFEVSPANAGEIDLRCVLHARDQASEQSARIVADAFDTKPRVCAGLSDVDLGLWQGLRMSDIRERYPKVYKQWTDDPLSLNPPEGEPLRAAQERLVEQLARGVEKASKGGKTSNPAVAVVLRPIAMALVRARLLGDASLVCWSRLPNAPAFEWHRIDHERMESLRSPATSGV